MLLRDLIGDLSDENTVTERLLRLDDLALVADLNNIAAACDETLAEYARAAMRRFANQASPDDWLEAMSSMKASDDPAMSLMCTMMRWAIVRDRHDLAAICDEHAENRPCR